MGKPDRKERKVPGPNYTEEQEKQAMFKVWEIIQKRAEEECGVVLPDLPQDLKGNSSCSEINLNHCKK